MIQCASKLQGDHFGSLAKWALDCKIKQGHLTLLNAEDLLGEGRYQLQKGYSPFLWQYALLKKLAIQLQQELQ